jgi:phage gpG-like protein
MATDPARALLQYVGESAARGMGESWDRPKDFPGLSPSMMRIGNTGLFHMARSSFPITIDFDPNVTIIRREFNELGADIRSFKVPLERAIREVMAPSFQRNFDVGGRPAWAPLHDFTREQKQRLGRSGGILVRTGALRRVAGQLNIWTVQGQQGRAFVRGLPNRVWYGRLHQQGSDSMRANVDLPPRPFIMAQQEDVAAVHKIFEEYIQDRINRKLQLRQRGIR